MTQLLILGGGAAGLMAAICAKEARPDVSVTLLEAGERVGKKLLATGNGRCNLTNEWATPADYAPADVQGVLSQLPPDKLMRKMEGMGLVLREEAQGRVYPASDAASSVLDALRLTAAHLQVQEVTGFCADDVRNANGAFQITAADGRRAQGARLVLATGGQAASKFTGYDAARALGHSVSPLHPALLPVKTDGGGIRGLNGVRCKCAATLLVNESAVYQEKGEVLFKEGVLSGIVIFQLTRHMARHKGRYEIELDLLPHLDDAQARQFIAQRARLLNWRGTDTFLLGMLHKNLAANLARAAGIGKGLVGDIPPQSLDALAHIMKHWVHKVTGTQGFQNAQVTVGGVPMGQVDASSLQSRVCPGLYLAGEVLDVDGPCGGYNLQWAWASGAVAGANAVKEL